ncbi:hypothetical protein H4J58_15760 [Colwellia sp. MB3u-70]|uniref:hypothetical protein n=1 Tax=unclassified Colwellia TaxID=196834 RepID=UPI0015F55F54|nr:MULTISPECIES: hypothetical protein [unclassified Colwellia]MBA6291923.1 hypothetical protein [Colwellia sp. MB3u-8]MBA6308567.1 hypothetical protein [Colwellia sp. MB3u-70]
MFTPVLTLALVASATFDSEQTITQQTAFIKSQANGQYARVMALKSSAQPALEKACRNALTLPARKDIKAALAKKLAITLPEKISYIAAKIVDYKQEYQQQWLTCTGEVSAAKPDINEAGLALRAAWWVGDQQDKKNIRPLLKVAMSHVTTAADAVALVAAQSPAAKRLQYLDSYLDVTGLSLEVAKFFVAKIWFENKRYKQVISLMNGCESIDCKRLNLAAKTQYEQITADDLTSYF